MLDPNNRYTYTLLHLMMASTKKDVDKLKIASVNSLDKLTCIPGKKLSLAQDGLLYQLVFKGAGGLVYGEALNNH